MSLTSEYVRPFHSRTSPNMKPITSSLFGASLTACALIFRSATEDRYTSNIPPLSATSLYAAEDSPDNHSCGARVDARGGSISSTGRFVSFTILGLGISITDDPDPPARLVHDQRRLIPVAVEIRRRARAHVIPKGVRRIGIDQERFDAFDECHEVRAEVPVLEKLRADIAAVIGRHYVWVEDGGMPFDDGLLHRVVLTYDDGHPMHEPVDDLPLLPIWAGDAHERDTHHHWERRERRIGEDDVG